MSPNPLELPQDLDASQLLYWLCIYNQNVPQDRRGLSTPLTDTFQALQDQGGDIGKLFTVEECDAIERRQTSYTGFNVGEKGPQRMIVDKRGGPYLLPQGDIVACSAAGHIVHQCRGRILRDSVNFGSNPSAVQLQSGRVLSTLEFAAVEASSVVLTRTLNAMAQIKTAEQVSAAATRAAKLAIDCWVNTDYDLLWPNDGSHRQTAVMWQLLKAGAEITPQDWPGRRKGKKRQDLLPVLIACAPEGLDEECARLLERLHAMGHGMGSPERGCMGAVHVAAHYGHMHSLSKLAGLGVDLDEPIDPNSPGGRPRSFAEAKGRHDAVAFIDAWKAEQALQTARKDDCRLRPL